MQSTLRTPDGRTRKIPRLPLGADPRAAVTHRDTPPGAIQGAVLLLLPLAPVPWPRAVLSVLGLACFPAIVGSPILSARSPPSPATSGRAALRATVSGLGMGGTKVLLTSLEETRSHPRLTSPLTAPSLAASLMWARGSSNLRRPSLGRGVSYLRSEAPFLIMTPPVVTSPPNLRRSSHVSKRGAGHHLARTHR